MKAKDFEILARSLRPGLVKVAFRIVDNHDEAEDVVQDTMLKLWSLRDSLDRYSSVEALAVVITRRLAINVLRMRRPTVAVEDYESADAETPLTVLENSENERRFDHVLSVLPESYRTLIELRHVEGYDNVAIAAILGSSEGAVRTALSRARRRVAEVFASVQ